MKKLQVSVLWTAAVALAALSGAAPASATTIGLPAGTTIEAAAEGTTTLHPPIGDISCEESAVKGKTENAGGASETVKGPISSLTFGKCNAEVVVLKAGSLEIHTRETSANNNGTLTSSGAEVTVTFVGFHCIFTTSSTDIGTVTGSANTGATATLDISAKIPRTGGRSGAFCGTTAEWTGSYKISNPDTLNVDGTSGGSSSLEGPVTLNVGSSGTVVITNNTESTVSVEQETTTNSLVLEMTGSSCLGNLTATSSCSRRQLKCVSQGQASYHVVISGVKYEITVRCD